MLRSRFLVQFLCVLVFFLTRVAAQAAPKTLGERLGYAADAKLLIVHADDLGVTHSVNAAALDAFKTGLVNSGSMMVPCSWFPEIAEYARTRPDADLGLHLTLTSERHFYRWGPVSAKEEVPDLIDAAGYFLIDWTPGKHIDAQQVKIELRAQIERAFALGVHPTHLDSHQFRLYGNGREIFRALIQLGHEYKLPVLVARNWFADRPYLQSELAPQDVVIDREVDIDAAVPPDRWKDFYTNAITSLQPGITELIIHVGYDGPEMRAFSQDRESWGAAWRQRDFDFFTSDQFRELLKQQHIQLITWRQVGAAVAQ
jgi:chitin disaccharide deacetylase